MWSTNHPPNGVIKSGDNDEAAKTRPAIVGESKLAITSQGIAMVTMALPSPEQRFAACSSTTRDGGRYRIV
jgi:hypothetical protein